MVVLAIRDLLWPLIMARGRWLWPRHLAMGHGRRIWAGAFTVPPLPWATAVASAMAVGLGLGPWPRQWRKPLAKTLGQGQGPWSWPLAMDLGHGALAVSRDHTCWTRPLVKALGLETSWTLILSLGRGPYVPGHGPWPSALAVGRSN